MNQEDVSQLTDDELLKRAKNFKVYDIYEAVIVGIMIGIAIYGAAKNGSLLLSLLPLFYVIFAVRNRKRRNQIKKEILKRNIH